MNGNYRCLRRGETTKWCFGQALPSVVFVVLVSSVALDSSAPARAAEIARVELERQMASIVHKRTYVRSSGTAEDGRPLYEGQTIWGEREAGSDHSLSAETTLSI